MIWWYLIVFIVTLVLSVALSPKPQGPQSAAIDDFSFPTAEEGRAIPVVFGTVDISGPNVLWYGDLSSSKIKKSSLFGSTTVGYKYYMGFHLGLCHGEADAVTNVTWGEKQAWAGNITANGSSTINLPDLFGGEKREGGISGSFDVNFGADDQEPNAYLVSKIGAVPAYRGIVSFIWKTGTQPGPVGPFGAPTSVKSGYIGTTSYVKPLAVRVRRILKGWHGDVWYSAKAVIDSNHMNPAHIMYQAMTDTEWGMGIPVANIDDAVFKAAADIFFNEGMGLSLIWNQSTTLEDFLQIILNHCAASLVLRNDTGKYQLIPIRGDYELDDLEEYTPSDIKSMDDFQRQGWGETTNEVTLVYTDPDTGKDTSITQQDLGNIASQGSRIATKVELKGLRDHALARTVLSRELASRSTPVAKGKFTINTRAWNVPFGRVFKLTWPARQADNMACRVTGISRGTLKDNTIVIDWVEDIFALGLAGYLSDITSPPDAPPIDPPPIGDSNEGNGAAVISATQTSPPLSPADGDAYLIPNEDAEDVWAGHEGQIAIWNEDEQRYDYIDVPNGTIIFDNENNQHVTVRDREVSSTTPWTPEVSLLVAEQNPLDGSYLPALMPGGFYRKLSLASVRAGTIKAIDVEFDDGYAGLDADNVQEAIDALAQPPTENYVRVKAWGSNGTSGFFYGETSDKRRFQSPNGLGWIERPDNPLPYSFEELIYVAGSHNKFYAKYGNQVGRSTTSDLLGTENWLYTGGTWPTPVRGHGAVNPGGALRLRYFDNTAHADTFIVFWSDYIFKSTDGCVTFSEVGVPVGLTYNSGRFRSVIKEIFWDDSNDRYIIFAIDTETNGLDAFGSEQLAWRPHVYTSPDLINFTLHKRLYDYPPSSSDDGLYYADLNCAQHDDMLVVCGNLFTAIPGGGVTVTLLYGYSVDAGDTWTYGPAAGITWPDTTHGLSAVKWDGLRFVIAGFGFTGVSTNLEDWDFSNASPLVSGLSETNEFLQPYLFCDGLGNTAAVSYETRPNGIRGLTSTKGTSDGLIWESSPSLPRIKAIEVSFDDSRTGLGVTEAQSALEYLKWQPFKVNVTVPDQYLYDFYKGEVQEITITEDTEILFAHGTTARVSRGTLIIRNDDVGGHTIIWPVGMVWSGGDPPPYSTDPGTVNVFDFMTVDGGATIYARMTWRNVYNDAGVPPAYPAEDALFPYNAFLMHFNSSTEGDQDIIDERGHTITVHDTFPGVPPGPDPYNAQVPRAEITLTTKKFGTGSMSFGANPLEYQYPTPSDELTFSTSNPAYIEITHEGEGSVMDISEGDWTLEGWIKIKSYFIPSLGYNAFGTGTILDIIDDDGHGLHVGIGGFGGFIPHVTCTTENPSIGLDSDFGDISIFAIGHDAGQILVDFEFRHFAVCRQGETIWVCCGGRAMQCKAGYLGWPLGKIPGLDVANYKIGEGGRYYLDEMRLVKGIARYTTKFYSPPTGPFPSPPPFVAPDDNRNEWTLGTEDTTLVSSVNGFDGEVILTADDIGYTDTADPPIGDTIQEALDTLAGREAGGTYLQPVANGDPDNPDYIFFEGDGVFVEAELITS